MISSKFVDTTIILISNTIIFILPISFILGNALLNLSLSLYIILFIVITLFKKDFEIYNNIYFKILIIFWFYLILNTLLVNFSENSLFKSLSYLRFIILPFAFCYFVNKFYFAKKLIFYFYTIIFLLISIDILIQYFSATNLLGYVPKMCLTISESLINENINKFDIKNIVDQPNTSGQVLINCERYSGIFNDELVAGSYLLLFAVPSLFFLINFNKEIKYSMFLFFLTLILILTASLLTGDRTPVLIMILTIIFFFIFSKIKLRNKFFIFLILFSLIFVIISSTPHLNHRFIKWPFETLKTSENVKSKVFQDKKKQNFLNIFLFETQWGLHYLTSYEMLLDNKLFGKGIKSFRTECKKYSLESLKEKYIDPGEYKNYKEGPKSGCSTHPHNIYFELLAETGIIGLLIFVIFILKLIIDTYLKNRSNNKIIFIFIFSFVVSYFFPIKPTGSFFSTWNGYFIWIIVSFYLYWSKIKISRLSNA